MEFNVNLKLKDSELLSEQRRKTLYAYKLLSEAITSDKEHADASVVEATKFLKGVAK